MRVVTDLARPALFHFVYMYKMQIDYAVSKICLRAGTFFIDKRAGMATKTERIFILVEGGIEIFRKFLL